MTVLEKKKKSLKLKKLNKDNIEKTKSNDINHLKDQRLANHLFN